MALFRIILLAFNVAVFTFLIYRLLQVYRSSVDRKGAIIFAGIILLLLPVVMLSGIMRPTPLYLLLYPVAISLYLFMIKNASAD